MATVRCPRYTLHWEETDCLSYYDMLSLHEVFEIVGSQLTETDVEVLSFLLEETYPGKHPLDPEGWTEDISPDLSLPRNPPCPRLLEAWRRVCPQTNLCHTANHHRPKSGVEMLLELERRGFLHEGNLEPLLQLLRILTRHDLLPFVSSKKRRTVSPERESMNYKDEENKEHTHCSSHTDPASLENAHTSQWRTAAPSRRKRGRGRGHMRGCGRTRGHGWTRKARDTSETLPQPAPNKVTCDIRLRVRAEYSEHESALRGRVSSDKQQPLERQFELFSRASLLLRTRDLGSIVCDIKFSELANLDAFWADYLSGALLEALKGVFITDSLKRAAGQEGLRLLVSVDQDDYEEGRKLLLSQQTHNQMSVGAWRS
ncbi:death effector domain-containing 1 isoform X2 [Brachyhypopomus gauderio]|uniref:death effector domain-containing 1 isoform X2 n=1 Tax=Brachyhypopomus gauderio TaxID=698409 RepID=UPI004041428A